jgi:hypothetical protein
MSTKHADPPARRRTPVVPLEAGAGPDNPPCPACGEPLFGWLPAVSGLSGPVRRCESCGLGVVGESAGAEEALAELDRARRGERVWIDNRLSFAASLGGAGWAALGPGARYFFTVEAVRRLVAQRDQVVSRARWSPQPSLWFTWQTLLNSVTFGHDVAFRALGWGEGVAAKKPWQRRIDALASVVLAIPALALALPIELAGGALGRGAVISLRRLAS